MPDIIRELCRFTDKVLDFCGGSIDGMSADNHHSHSSAHHSSHSAQPMKRAGLTKGAQIVLDALEQIHELASAQDIYGRLRQSGDKAPGLTTVYRSLESLVAMGYVQAVDLGDGEKRYEVVNPGEHHHHLICDACGESNHLDLCMVEEFEEAIRAKYGFQIKSHVLEIFGVCSSCHSKEK